MTNTTYDLKPGYYWKITPSTDPDRAAVLSLMQLTTAWTSDNVVAQYSLEHVPATHDEAIKKAMSRIKTYYPQMFADYTEDVVNYNKALKNITSSVLP